MIGCKVMRTLASVKIEIMLIFGLPCCLSSSRVRCLDSDVYPLFVDPERLPARLTKLQSSELVTTCPEDPYEAIRQAYLDGTNTMSEPFEDPIDTETPELALTVALPISLSESTPPVLVSILRRTARMAARVPPAMSSYESSPSVSPPDLPSRKHYRGTYELVDDSEEDEEIEESLDFNSIGEDAEDEGSTIEDEDPTTGDEGLTAGVEDPSTDDEKEEEKAVPGGQQQAAPVVGTDSGSAPESERPERVSTSRKPTLTTWTDLEDGMVYIDVHTYPPPATPVQKPPSPEWTSGLLPISPSPSVVPSPVSSPMIPLTVPSPVATPSTTETEGFLTELGAQVQMQRGLISDHAVQLEELSPALFKRSLDYEQERVAVTFGAIWIPVLALESWACQTDA
ncbi:hypothetical protein Tco_0490826 [Tanacetum coccineum]